MKIFKRIIQLVIALFLIYVAIFLVCIIKNPSNQIQDVHYTIKNEDLSSLRIVQLCDLHDAEYGADNEKLIQKVAEQEPNIIMITGDMINDTQQDISAVVSLVSELTDIAPVYYGFGNHERMWVNAHGEKLFSELTRAGACVVEGDYVDVVWNDTPLRIGGYSGYYGTPHLATKNEMQQEEDSLFFQEFEDTSRYKILLCHIPLGWLDWDYIDQYPVDLVLCGHYHGGVVQLPFIGGVYAPYVGWFPKHTEGIYEGTKATCIISTGLGTEHGVRLNNPPQIVVIDFE